MEKYAMGGGKTSVKLTSYVCLLTLIIITIFVMSSQNLVNAAPKEKAKASSSKSKQKSKAKRAATTSKSSKESSSTKKNKNTKRAAVSNSNSSGNGGNSATKTSSANNKRVSSTKRAVSRVAPKAKPTTTSGSSNTNTNTNTNTASTTTVCPVEAFLRMYHDDDNDKWIYYSSKKTECTLPNDGDIVNVVAWKKEDKANYDKALQTRPSWINEAETVFLTCAPGYVEKTLDKVKTCVNISGICPMNKIVEKSGKTYINPDTQEECFAPEKSIVRNVKGDENLLSYTLADENAYKFECPANFYPVADEKTSIKVKCEACPMGSTSPSGSSSISDCVNEEEEARKRAEEEARKQAEEEAKKQAEEEAARKQAEEEAKRKQQEEAEAKKQKLEEEYARLAKLRIKKVEGTTDDYTCIDGWTNNWTYDSKCRDFVRAGFVMDKDGKIKNVVDRTTYGKNKRGCPIKLDGYLSFASSSLRFDKFSKILGDLDFERSYRKNCPDAVNFLSVENRARSSAVSIRFCPSSSSTTFPAKIGILKKKMESSDIDNTGVNGWTEEEYEAWDGYRPIIGTYYDFSSKLDGKAAIYSTSQCRASSSSYYVGGYSPDNFENIRNNASEKNLFNYWN